MGSSGLFIVTIVALALGASIWKQHLRIKERRLEGGDGDCRARIDALEERVRTLEKIVTDQNYSLKREFEKL